MRYLQVIILSALTSFSAIACQSAPATHPVSLQDAGYNKVAAALSHWPAVTPGATAIKRPFFATLHIAGRRTTASGILEYYAPRDFRLTAVTELGTVLFDGRCNWAGTTVLRHLPGVDDAIIELLIKDISRAFEPPPGLEGLTLSTEGFTIKKTLADTHRYEWTFDAATGYMKQMSVNLGLLDTLQVEYRQYNARGWPEELHIARKARFIDVSMTFTDNNVVRRE